MYAIDAPAQTGPRQSITVRVDRDASAGIDSKGVERALQLQRAAPDVRITVTSALAHAIPRISLTNLAGIAALHSFFVRSLAAASSHAVA